MIEEADALGVLQTHFSGGEPTLRPDLPELIRHAAGLGQYTNLITAAVLLDEAKVEALAEAGLDHVQISIQDSEPANANRIGGYKDGHAKKLAVARLVREAGLPLTINAVMHRQNLDRLGAIIELAVELGAKRLEVAHTQYYGWALPNRVALMPTRAQAERSIALVEAARERLKGVLVIDAVVPDYYARYPKPCMGGWGRQNLNVTPSGKVLPCHAAETITGLRFDNVKERPLAEIWYRGEAFNAFRGTGWMQEPCRSCPRQAQDFGGCRCQAFALTGDARATDPACSLSPRHAGAGRDRGPRGPPGAAGVRLSPARQRRAGGGAGAADPGRVSRRQLLDRGQDGDGGAADPAGEPPAAASPGRRRGGARGRVGIVGRFQILPFLAARAPVAGAGRDPPALGREALEQRLRIGRPVQLEIGLAQIFERAAVVRVELERPVVEHERLVVVAELAPGEAGAVVGVGVPGPGLDHLRHLVDHGLPVARLERRDAGLIGGPGTVRRLGRGLVQAGDRAGRGGGRHPPQQHECHALPDPHAGLPDRLRRIILYGAGDRR